VIARVWRGATRAADEDAYVEYLESSGMRAARELPGSRGTIVLRRRDGELTEFVTLLLFDSIDDVNAFAGDDVSVARFFPDDDRWLLERDLDVRHYEVDAHLD